MLKTALTPLAAAALLSCGPRLSCGEVVDKEHIPERNWTETVCDVSMDLEGVPLCLSSHEEPRHSPPRWYLVIGGLMDGKWATNKVEVPQVVHNNTKENTNWCRPGESVEKAD